MPDKQLHKAIENIPNITDHLAREIATEIADMIIRSTADHATKADFVELKKATIELREDFIKLLDDHRRETRENFLEVREDAVKNSAEVNKNFAEVNKSLAEIRKDMSGFQSKVMEMIAHQNRMMMTLSAILIAGMGTVMALVGTLLLT